VFRSYRYNFLAALLLAIVVATTNAQQSNQQQPIGSPPGIPNVNSQGTRIAIIFTDFFYDPNDGGINRLVSAIKNLDQEFQPRKMELQRLQQRIEQLTNETSGPAPGVAPTTVQSKRDEIEQLKKDSQRKAEDAQAEYSKRLVDTLNPIFEALEKAIKTFAQQRGIDLILDGSKMDDALLYMSDGLDLSRAFIVEFNRANASPAAPSPR
jgi:Skp family chaperone for outer membrane proteins